MGSLIGSALIGGASSLIGNLFGKKSNDKSNETNLRIAQMNNEWNERMLQKEMDYNYDMWQEQNAYNDPSAQRARMEVAGYNPYMALGQISSGTAGSVGGVKTPSAQPVTVQPYQPDFSGIGQAAQAYAANKLNEESIEGSNALKAQQAEQLRIQNEYEAARLTEYLNNLREDTKSKRLKNFFQQRLNRFAADQFSTDIRYKERQIQAIEADVHAKSVNTAIKELQLHHLPKQYELTFAGLSADLLLKEQDRLLKIKDGVIKDKQAELIKRQISHELQKEFKTTAEKLNISLNNRNLRRMSDAIVEKAIQESINSDYRLPVGTRNWFDLKNRSYGNYPVFE